MQGIEDAALAGCLLDLVQQLVHVADSLQQVSDLQVVVELVGQEARLGLCLLDGLAVCLGRVGADENVACEYFASRNVDLERLGIGDPGANVVGSLFDNVVDFVLRRVLVVSNRCALARTEGMSSVRASSWAFASDSIWIAAGSLSGVRAVEETPSSGKRPLREKSTRAWPTTSDGGAASVAGVGAAMGERRNRREGKSFGGYLGSCAGPLRRG